MAASTLGMLSPATRFQRMNVHRTLLGIFAGVPYLGSIDFLDGQARLAAWADHYATGREQGGNPTTLGHEPGDNESPVYQR